MPDVFNAEIEKLRQQYLTVLPQRARQIEELWQRLRYLNWSPQGVQSLHTLVHRLAGSGANFGLPTVSDNARILDVYLQEHLSLKQPFGAIEYKKIDQMVMNLALALNHTDTSKGISALQKPQAFGLGKHIFVVDDDDVFSALIATYLRNNGFTVQQFTHPSECILRLQQQTPYAILMDICFQDDGKQGLDAIEQIKIHLGHHVPIMVLSARTDIHARLRALRSGCAHYLIKPIDFSLLIKILITPANHFNPTRRVMVVDDDRELLQYHGELLRSAGMEVLCINKPLESLQQAIKFNPDLVILDMHMPDINGIELATLLREEERFLVLPIIFITADKSVSLHRSIESLGVNGILIKPVNIEQLMSTCDRAIKDTIALKNRMACVAHHTDQNQHITRSYFFGAIENALQQQRDDEESTALYYVSSNNIAALLAEYGQTGINTVHEQFCRIIGQAIANGEQWSDISNLVVCVLAGRRTQVQHQQRATQLIAYLHDAQYDIMGEKIVLNANVGISYLDHEFGAANSLLHHAELAYEEACALQGKKTDVSDKQHINTIEKNIHLVLDVSEGLPTDNLRISYQPMISIEEHKFEHFEVLIRWKADDNELIPASQFLHQIKNTSIRLELDRWVLQTAINAMMMDTKMRENADLFFHLTEEALQQKSFFPFVANVMRSSRLRGDRRLIFMLEESWVAGNQPLAEITIKALNDIHCGICLSHAGITVHCESIINHFKFDFIKLVPQLTNNIQQKTDAITRIQSIAAAAINSHAKIIATQVDGSKSIASLWKLGIRLFQGNYIQSPDLFFHEKNDVDFSNPDI